MADGDVECDVVQRHDIDNFWHVAWIGDDNPGRIVPPERRQDLLRRVQPGDLADRADEASETGPSDISSNQPSLLA